MPKKVSPEEFKFEIEQFIGVLKESDKHDWCKAVAKISWNDKPSNLEIRSINLALNKVGKGIGLTDEEVDRLVDILLDEDYGSLEALERAITRKRNRFTVLKGADKCFDDEENGLFIEIKMPEENKDE